MKIKVLPDVVINQISAGEVVERPASVVRELVENSLDAGADDVTVTLEQGGHALIRVLDNGAGMERDDALLALERHATSKIHASEDLQNIATLGFRGEALPAIAAVSKLRIRTRSAQSQVGTEVTVAGGAVKNVSPVPASAGTEVEVRALFFNTPARRKFLKSPRNEELRVKQWLFGSALAHPHVRFRLTLDGKEALNLPRRGTSRERAQGLFGGSVVAFEENDAYGLSVCGLVGHPGLASSDTGSFLILVNARVVSDRMILRAIKEGFASTLKEREFPLGYMALSLPGSKVDVNVHPQKSEVRFADPQSIFLFVRGVVMRATSEFRSPVAFMAARQTRAFADAGDASQQPSLELEAREPTRLEEAAAGGEYVGSPAAADGQAPFRFSNLRYFGQALQCYLFCEYDGRVYVVDMHAAHERYNYNLVRNGYRVKNLPSQQLLIPLSVEVGERGVARFRENEALFREFGFELEIFGETALLVRAVPALLADCGAGAVIREAVALEEDELADGRLSERVDHLAARIACHASVRSGQSLSREEVQSLFAALDRSEFSAACPHGRPIIVSFKESDIERWFGRDR